MRRVLVALLLLLMMTCVAFAETDGAEPGEQAAAIDLDKVEMSLDQTEYYKTGSPIEPAPVLMYEGEALSPDLYTLEYADNVNVGTATVTAVFEEGSKSINFEIVPAVPGDAAITKVQSKLPDVIVTWKSVACAGYELEVSTSSSFSKADKYALAEITKSIGKLKDGKKYYFRVRAQNTENGKTTYGNWSTYSSKVNTTGVVGNKYSQDGEFVKNKTVKISGNYYYYNTDGIRSGCAKKMWDKVKNSSSKTKYLIAVDCSKNRTCIYKGKKGKWELKSYWKCTTGKKSTPTIKGNFKVKGKVSHFGESKGYSVWYATRIKGEYYFHSVLYKPYSKKKIKDGRLGQNLSHGCIRLKLKNAKWIYKNCKKGTRIIIY